METKYRSSITSFSAYSQSQQIVEELKEDLATQFDDEVYQAIIQLLDAKQTEITERYTANKKGAD